MQKDQFISLLRQFIDSFTHRPIDPKPILVRFLMRIFNPMLEIETLQTCTMFSRLTSGDSPLRGRRGLPNPFIRQNLITASVAVGANTVSSISSVPLSSLKHKTSNFLDPMSSSCKIFRRFKIWRSYPIIPTYLRITYWRLRNAVLDIRGVRKSFEGIDSSDWLNHHWQRMGTLRFCAALCLTQ
jgi:hypothetical protein